MVSMALLSPLAWLGRQTIATVIELGRMATLLGQAARSLVRPGPDDPPFRPALVRQLAALLGMGLALVGLFQVGTGLFLSMQAYYGGTFVDGTGAVVGVGLFRNLGPLFAGLVMAGLIAARTTTELRTRPWATLDGDPLWVADRDAQRVHPQRQPDLDALQPPPQPSRLAAVRITAAIIAGPILALWGTVVGIVIGWKSAGTMLGVSTHGFFSMMWEMLWLRDLSGLVIKGILYGLLAALCACHEGLRCPAGSAAAGAGTSAEADPRSHSHSHSHFAAVEIAAFRAACLASVAILMINSGWFLLFYHAGPAFGPTLMNL
jgi:phospholipid/cholesterol/gamma-HCH transport system permease protein